MKAPGDRGRLPLLPGRLSAGLITAVMSAGLAWVKQLGQGQSLIVNF